MHGQWEKSCEIKGAAKKWLWWYRLKAKILITTIQVNLCCLIPASLEISTKFTWIVVIKFFHQPIPSQPFLGRHFDFTTFSHWPFLNRAAPFSQPGCFWVAFINYITRVFFSVAGRRKRTSRCGDSYYFYWMYCIHIFFCKLTWVVFLCWTKFTSHFE